MKRPSKQDFVVPILLLNVALTIRSVAASYRASEWAAEGWINKISATADYLSYASVFVLISLGFSLLSEYSKEKTGKYFDYLTIIFVALGAVVVLMSTFIR